jgi:excisionase family DNA binding protein
VPASSESTYFTVAQAARLLAVSPSTIWRWIDAGKLQAYRLGGRTIRIRRSDLESVVQPARAGGPDERLTAEEVAALQPPTPEELARRDAAVARVLEVRARTPSIAPLTVTELIRRAREEEGASYDPGEQ